MQGAGEWRGPGLRIKPDLYIQDDHSAKFLAGSQDLYKGAYQNYSPCVRPERLRSQTQNTKVVCLPVLNPS